MIKVINNKILIEPTKSMTNLGNGLQINNETQSRKDIVCGVCIDGEYKDKKIFYPLYSANPIQYEGVNYHIIDVQDILAYDDNTNN